MPTITTSAAGLLAALAADPAPPPFAVLLRQDAPGVEVLTGDVTDVPRLADLPLPGPGDAPVLALVPFRQIGELGYAHHDDATPLRCLKARRCEVLTREEALTVLPTDDVPLTGASFDLDDDAYGEVVKRVIAEEIGRGEGANFVVRRDLRAHQPLPPARAALAVLRRLLEQGDGAYWTFAVHAPLAGTPSVTMVGATPERHVSARAGTVVMNPISGTFRYPPGGPTRAGLLDFLRDRKEVEELFMVVDEELKMMSGLCERGGRVLGPFLKPMGHLAHTEYLLTGTSDADPREVLRATMFAATVTGSPVQNACRVIARHERTGRGYYAGMAALLSQGPQGPELDAPILIRTAYLGADGAVRLPGGRHPGPAQRAGDRGGRDLRQERRNPGRLQRAPHGSCCSRRRLTTNPAAERRRDRPSAGRSQRHPGPVLAGPSARPARPAPGRPIGAGGGRRGRLDRDARPRAAPRGNGGPGGALG